MSAATVITVANDLIANHTKVELINMSRNLGWRGDHARTPILVFALFIASKSTEDTKQPPAKLSHDVQSSQQSPDAPKDAPAPNLGDLPSWANPEQGEQQNAPKDAPEPSEQQQREQSEVEKLEQQLEQAKQNAQQRAKEQFEQEQSERGGFEQAKQQPQQPQPDAPKSEPEPTPESSQREQSKQSPEQPEPEQDDSPKQDRGDEFEQLLKKSGIKQPHRLLEKLWRLTTKAKQNVMLSGPAGAGKTTLAHQLSQLLTVPFASISCTAGMSESQLTGWLLPVGDNGRFEHVASPFIRSIQEPSVFLLDEMDAADANVVLAMNSLLANSFLTVSHKLDNPTIMRHDNSIIVAGVNSVGGGDDVYTARTILDGSTLDRFYIMPIDYDEAYEAQLFNRTKRAGRKSPKWQKSTAVIDATIDEQLCHYFFSVRRCAEKNQIRQLVSTRFSQKLLAACDAGIPIEEVKSDLLSAWTTDERAFLGAK